jgi:hypothetical protein
MIKVPLLAKLHVCKFERKGYNKVTPISLKKHNSYKEYTTKQGYKK